MAVLDIKNTNGDTVAKADLPDAVFNIPVKPEVLHQVVTMQLANKRTGTASVKHRGEVSGSRRKLYRQKGTGRARRGDIKSPLLRGGGVIFGPDNRNYAYRLPKKIRQLALKMALSSKLQNNSLTILQQFPLPQIKTKHFVEIVDRLGIQDSLIITDLPDHNLEISSRNVPGVKVLRAEGLNVYDILKYRNLVLLEASIKKIEGRLLQ
ncbi:MAG: 50S ribosomal protein L4 [Thermodesulfobacteriota bacterium]